MRRMVRFIIPAAAVILSAAWFSPYNDEVSAGNKAMGEKQYSEAMNHYRRAKDYADNDSKRAILDFNMGDAEYSAGNYDSAIEYFKKTAALPDREIAKKSWFNIGNSYYKKNMKKEAASAYAKALELDPEYEKARKNLEYLRKKNDNKNNDRKNQGADGSEGSQGNSGGKDNNSGSKGGTGKKEMTPEELNRIFESMKNKPVRKQDDGGKGRRMFEKYW